MSISNVNNPNYIPAYIETTRYGAGGPNTNGLTQLEITERKLRREVGSRVDPDGSLMASHIAQINMMRANGQLQGSAMRMRDLNGVSTPASEQMRNQHLTAIRDLMAKEEEGSLRMNVLQRMLDTALNPPTSIAQVNGNGILV